MQVFLKLLIGALKVIIFMFLHSRTERKHSQEREESKTRHQRAAGSSLSSEILIFVFLSGG
jgi:preprotein translocase subunit YajC